MRSSARVLAAAAARVSPRARFIVVLGALLRLQGAVRSCERSLAFDCMKTAVVVLQTAVRSHVGRATFGRVRREARARVLQGFVRGQKERRVWRDIQAGGCVIVAAGRRCVLRVTHVRATAAGRTLLRSLMKRGPRALLILKRASAATLQALVRACAIRAMKHRMAVMMSRKLLASRFRRWSVRRRYCTRLLSTVVICASAARALARARDLGRIAAALALLPHARRCCCRRRLLRRIAGAVVVQAVARRTCARGGMGRRIGAGYVVAACECACPSCMLARISPTCTINSHPSSPQS
jgi:hypothetical protein